MTLKERVENLLESALEERKDLFIIAVKVSVNGEIRVVIDGDKGVTLDDCIEISRAIEHPLNEEDYDFSLEVMSPGAAEPLVNDRQYHKNIGRTLNVKTLEGTIYEGVLTHVSNDNICISWKERQPKLIGKGKVTVKMEKEIPFKDVAEAKVKIKFN
jgi:ribosome maturation factor RimP